MTLLNLRQLFFDDLSALYSDEKELNSLFYAFINDLLGINRTMFVLSQTEELSKEKEKEVLQAIKRLGEGEAFQYVIGWQEFCGRRFNLNSSVLIPRVETEELVQMLLKREQAHDKLSVLDIGTGSGCIAISIKYEKKNWNVSAVDISVEALEKAKHNAMLHDAKINFLSLDILSKSAEEKLGMYDVIISNPPYVMESEKEKMSNNVLDNEPATALFVSNNNPLVFYRRIAELGKTKLKPQGWLYFEINSALGTQMFELLNELGYKNIELKQDLYNRDRFITAQL